jgi:hypothetical protein
MKKILILCAITSVSIVSAIDFQIRNLKGRNATVTIHEVGEQDNEGEEAAGPIVAGPQMVASGQTITMFVPHEGQYVIEVMLEQAAVDVVNYGDWMEAANQMLGNWSETIQYIGDGDTFYLENENHHYEK